MWESGLYSVHVELAHIRIWITSDRNEVWTWDLYHSTALVEAPRNLAPLNVIGHGKVPYQKPRLKSMGACCTSAQRRVLRNVLAQCAVAIQRERGIAPLTLPTAKNPSKTSTRIVRYMYVRISVLSVSSSSRGMSISWSYNRSPQRFNISVECVHYKANYFHYKGSHSKQESTNETPQ